MFPRMLRGLASVALGVAIMAPAVWLIEPAVAQRAAGSQTARLVTSAAVAHKQAVDGELVLVDIRRPEEWLATGIPASGYAITMHQNGRNFLKSLMAAAGNDRNQRIALICATGGRSEYLQKILRQAGFSNIIDVSEGMLGSPVGSGWLKQKLPVRRWTGINPAPGSTPPK